MLTYFEQKIFSPDQLARSNARKGIGVMAADPAGWSSINHGRRGGVGSRRVRQQQAATTASTVNLDSHVEAHMESEETDTEPPPGPNGLASRKRMDQEYQITSRNDIERQGGNREAVISRAMLTQIAARMRAARNGNATAGAADGGGEDTSNPPIVIMGPDGEPIMVQAPNNCTTM